MDLATLAAQAVAALAPALPFLLDKGGKAADAAIEKIGEDAWETAKRVWARTRGKEAADGDVEKAADTLARVPENDRLRRKLALEIEGLLEEDPTAAAALAELLGTSGVAQRADVSGAGAVGQALDTAIVSGAHGSSFGGNQINIQTLQLYV